MENDRLYIGDCLTILPQLPSACANLLYLDPPFFTRRRHSSTTRDGQSKYSFDDVWRHSEDYRSYLAERVTACKRVLRSDGSIFVHCDHNSAHIVRQTLDLVFGEDNFQSEIVWAYRRWSNTKRGLLQQHQNILFYSRTGSFKWNPINVDYSATTNVDQILQKRSRDHRGKAVYATDTDGAVVYGTEKRGVPLGDVWEIPFLNPKAKERTGYPTQKPLLLLERIIRLTTTEEDLVVDPFCGSGTTVVAAKLLNRRYIGIDVSSEAIAVAESRLQAPIRTESALLRDGIAAYRNDDPWVEAHLSGFSYSRVQRNFGADALLKDSVHGRAAFLRVQRKGEALSACLEALQRLLATKGNALGFLIATEGDLYGAADSNVQILPSAALQLSRIVKSKDQREVASAQERQRRRRRQVAAGG